MASKMSESEDVLEVEVIDLTELTDHESSEDGHNDSSDSEESDNEEILADQQSRAHLHSAISSASESRLKNVLANIVERVPEAEKIALREFVARKRKTKEFVVRWDTCERCEEEFDVHTKRDDEECVYHPGELAPDVNRFPGWDETVHGPMDRDDVRQEYPHKFFWDCCDKDSLTEGCRTGRHRSITGAAAKKARL